MQTSPSKQDQSFDDAVSANLEIQSKVRERAMPGPVALRADWLDRVGGGATKPGTDAPKTTW